MLPTLLLLRAVWAAHGGTIDIWLTRIDTRQWSGWASKRAEWVSGWNLYAHKKGTTTSRQGENATLFPRENLFSVECHSGNNVIAFVCFRKAYAVCLIWFHQSDTFVIQRSDCHCLMLEAGCQRGLTMGYPRRLRFPHPDKVRSSKTWHDRKGATSDVPYQSARVSEWVRKWPVWEDVLFMRPPVQGFHSMARRFRWLHSSIHSVSRTAISQSVSQSVIPSFTPSLISYSTTFIGLGLKNLQNKGSIQAPQIKERAVQLQKLYSCFSRTESGQTWATETRVCMQASSKEGQAHGKNPRP